MPDFNTPFKIWIPQQRDQIFFEVTITDSNGVTTSVKDDLLFLQVIWPTIRKGGIGSFNLRLSSNERKYLDKYVKGNIVSVYIDYTDGTSLYKTFYMEEPRYGYSNGYLVYIKGRDYPQLADDRITVDFSSGIEAKDAFETIVSDNYSSVVNTTGVSSAMNTTIYGGYELSPPVQIFADILERVGYDGRLESDGTITTFEDTGVLSTTETFILGQNIKSLSGFGTESNKEKNKTLIIGGDLEGCPLLRMKQNTTQQTLTWKKTDVFKKSSIKSLDDAEEVAITKNTENAVLEDSGTGTSLLMATLKPGQQIMCSMPDCKLIGDYFVGKLTLTLSPDEGGKTTLDLNETEDADSSFLIRERERREAERTLDNPNAMTDTLILFDFNNEDGIESLTNLTVENGKLKLVTGQSEGTMISELFTADSNFINYEVRGQYNDDSELLEVHASNDNAYSYKQIGIGDFNDKQVLTLLNKKGRLKVVLRSNASNSKPELDSVCMLVKRN